MPSRPDLPRRPLRALFEGVLRVASLALIVLLIGHALYALRQRPVLRAGGPGVADALARWSTVESPRRVHVTFDSAPRPGIRDWVAALPRAGTEATWDGSMPQPGAIAVEPVADPQRPSRVWVATTPGTPVILADQMGLVDSATAEGAGAVFVLPRFEGWVRATIDGGSAQRATALTNDLRDSLTIRSALVVGMAGWETKFVTAALEERGWDVDARLAVSPSGDVEQGRSQIRLDTARYSFVVAVDSIIRRYADQLPRYVRRQGGGLIVVGEASRAPPLAPLLPARWGLPSRPTEFREDTSDEPRRSLALGELYDLKDGAAALEHRGDLVSVAAWRAGEGRVIQIGYLDTWRWRMAGLEADAVENHRRWWAALASGVAYAPRFDLDPPRAALEPTPLATMIDRIGTPQAPGGPELAGLLDDPRLLPWAFGALLALLLLEWASRRLRGRE